MDRGYAKFGLFNAIVQAKSSYACRLRDNGIEIQVYCSMIACLLISLWTGGKPNQRTFEMISYYFQGLASEEELLAHIEKQRQATEAKRDQAESAKIC